MSGNNIENLNKPGNPLHDVGTVLSEIDRGCKQDPNFGKKIELGVNDNKSIQTLIQFSNRVIPNIEKNYGKDVKNIVQEHFNNSKDKEKFADNIEGFLNYLKGNGTLEDLVQLILEDKQEGLKNFDNNYMLYLSKNQNSGEKEQIKDETKNLCNENNNNLIVIEGLKEVKEEKEEKTEEKEYIKEEEKEKTEEKENIKEEEKEKTKEFYKRIELLYKKSQEIEQKVIPEGSKAQVEELTQQKQQEISQAAKAKGVELSSEQLRNIAYSGAVMDCLPAYIPDEHKDLVKSFANDYDKMASWLGILPTGTNKISQRANDLAQLNPSVEKFVNQSRGEVDLDKDSSEKLDKYATANESREDTEARLNAMRSSLIGQNSFEFGLKYFETILGKAGIKGDFVKPEKESNLNIDGGFEAKISVNGIASVVKLANNGNILMTDYLNSSKDQIGVIDHGQKIVNPESKAITITNFEEIGKKIDIRDCPKTNILILC